MSAQPITKFELWQELGRKFGVPPKGTPEYEHKKAAYKHALLNVDIVPSPVTCSCSCDCEARRPRGNARRLIQSRCQPPPQPMRSAQVRSLCYSDDYSDYSDEEPIRPPPKGGKGKVNKYYSDSECSESDWESSDEEEKYTPPKRGRPPAKQKSIVEKKKPKKPEPKKEKEKEKKTVTKKKGTTTKGRK